MRYRRLETEDVQAWLFDLFTEGPPFQATMANNRSAMEALGKFYYDFQEKRLEAVTPSRPH
jgi:hypothetical protein